mmetsp:Transcript_12903/g.42126  ORF Transcript_12903/g.42126 Transcript_12903/m.42126 type:complete len:206 (+) Transcript_12903:184-801(+)|eukprot:CAMPEP_0118899998 /NCGR_PEP_ID=MMETSP1166-20130328/6312_1 /TAXON_ID=1104430 /ORGANISM="Chrysoreinhardia sp, Strain CCMP3193" /LENGTH=205 /DNA_ID=CAMNT_0006839131 /DNA_START=125 /DNA_END=742 /DNA_ORIENTATION=-
MKSRAERHAIMLAAKQLFAESPLVAVAALSRGDVQTMTKARREFRQRSLRLRKIPNSLCAKALEGSDRNFLRGLFVGQTIVVYPEADSVEDDDPPALAKRLLESLGETPTFHLMGGALNTVPLYPEDFIPLSKMPGSDELRAQVARAIKTPLARTATMLKGPSRAVANALAAPTRKLGRALAAHKDKNLDDNLDDNERTNDAPGE